jgi:peptide/nickel transport system ATP-binding protein/oligopeptide transport system ATP-binding protein
MDEPLLAVRDLAVQFTSGGRVSRAPDGVDLDVRAGETVGLVGETGCGKSATALAVMGLIPSPPGRVVSGRVLFAGEDLLSKSPLEMRRLRGSGISMVFQEPMTSLDPSFTIGSQLVEVLEAHRGLGGRAGRREAVGLLEDVRLPHPERVLAQYPFQLSGGMRQRVMIALALSCRPRLLIADEPTSALDVTVQAQIFVLLRDMQARLGTAILLITHDLAVVAENCSRAYVMYAGRIAETAPVAALFGAPRHPYTRGLLGAVPGAGEAMRMIPGEVPSATNYPPGCRFWPRCAYAMDRCRGADPPLTRVDPGHHVACYLYGP